MILNELCLSCIFRGCICSGKEKEKVTQDILSKTLTNKVAKNESHYFHEMI